MLQSISPTHDSHHLRHRQNSLASLTASLSDGKTHLLLAASGSVSTIKLPLIIRALSSRYASSSSSSSSSSPALSIRVLLTPCAARFLAGQSAEQPTVSSLLSIPGVDGVYADADEWREPWRRGDAVLHIELRRWADLLVVAPLSANTMAKIVGGFADGLLTSVVRAWDAWGELDGGAVGPQQGEREREQGQGKGQGQGQQGDGDSGDVGNSNNGSRRRMKQKRIIVAPAMNTAMWRHPVTTRHLRVLEQEWGVSSSASSSSFSTSHPIREDSAVAPLPPPPSAAVDESKLNGGGFGGSGEQPIDGWFEVLRPQQKRLACGDFGDGAMMEWTEIVSVIEDRLGLLSS